MMNKKLYVLLLFDQSKHCSRVDIELARSALSDNEDDTGLIFPK